MVGNRLANVIIVVFILLLFILWCEALKKGATGACEEEVPITVKKTRRSNYCVGKGKNRKCVTKVQIIPHTERRNMTVCCDGWQHNMTTDTCEPRCSRGCIGGQCLAPDLCYCTPPSVLKLNECKMPVCDTPCVNSRCSADNFCECTAGFDRINKTHCAPPCPIGFYLDRHILECVLKCNESCVNGSCTATNYENDPDNKFNCRPICDPKCINASCVAPNTCACLPGFQKGKEEFTCEPKCDSCENGTCVAPNDCQCHEGYSKKEGTICTPDCAETCTHGYCSAPNTCTCEPGYEIDPDNIYNCLPVCEPKCMNASCIAPDKCTCFLGFQKGKDEWTCEPKCNSCEHGTCVAPNDCQCHEGYSKKEGIICTPDCAETCTHGDCSAPNTCTCKPGHEIDPDNKYNCLPVCEPKCIYASCVAPNRCECFIGYEGTGNNWICEPKCNNCKNGDCLSPNECRCYQGYSKKGDDTCTPDCAGNCTNGVCSKPNVCTCNEGYRIEDGDPYTCSPVCEHDCINGICISPNKCTCQDGYQFKEDFVCEPKCSLCEHGDCVAPENCHCHHGYEMKDGICSPICKEPCVNGLCSAPDVCSCVEDYMRNETKPWICYKPCITVCSDGECNLDGNCICHPGYELNNDTCTKMTPVECSTCEGNCTQDACWCFDGRPCVTEEIPEPSSTSLAGLELTWLVAGIFGLVLLTTVIIVIERIWHSRKQFEAKAADDGNPYGSVVYTVPDTLLDRNCYQGNENEYETCGEGEDCEKNDEMETAGDRLLTENYQDLRNREEHEDV